MPNNSGGLLGLFGFQSTPGGAATGYPNISRPGMLFSALGQEKRSPYPSESAYFKANPTVGGMATEDGKVTINPFSPLSQVERQHVANNEALRLLLRKASPLSFQLTPEQNGLLSTTTYANASEQDRRATILARLLSGDPSAGQATPEQTSGLLHVLLNAKR